MPQSLAQKSLRVNEDTLLLACAAPWTGLGAVRGQQNQPVLPGAWFRRVRRGTESPFLCQGLNDMLLLH